jgi:Spy/CpxP family protein refolding chaperone
MKIQKMSFLVSLLSFAFTLTLHAQVTVPPDKEQLLSGGATGQTVVAEKNGFPAPQKVVSFKDQLGLTKDQLKKMNEIITNLPIAATIKGQDIVEAEEELNKLFESGTINEKTLRTKLERIGKMRAELRFVHLQVYLKEKLILTAKQWERLKELQASEVK